MKYLILILVLLPLSAQAQRTMSEYTAAQRASLRAYLAENPSYRFVSETQFDQQSLRYLRSSEGGMGRNWKPYFQVGDFNGDGQRDFAVLLLNGSRVSSASSRFRFVIFSQAPGNTYTVDFDQQVRANPYTFVNVVDGMPCWGLIDSEGECYAYSATRGFTPLYGGN